MLRLSHPWALSGHGVHFKWTRHSVGRPVFLRIHGCTCSNPSTATWRVQHTCAATAPVAFAWCRQANPLGPEQAHKLRKVGANGVAVSCLKCALLTERETEAKKVSDSLSFALSTAVVAYRAALNREGQGECMFVGTTSVSTHRLALEAKLRWQAHRCCERRIAGTSVQ